MTHAPRRNALLALTLLAAACAPTAAVEQPAPAARPPARPTFSIVGLEAVIGRNARTLEAQFGRPQLDVQEGAGRKLQFANSQCVLDAYLYAPRAGAEAVVTHVDARLPDGRDTDRAGCVASLSGMPRVR